MPTARLVTPALTGSLLPGVTRDSLLTLAGDLGYVAEEGRISTDEWREGNASPARSPRSSPAAPRRSSPRSARSAPAAHDWTVGDGGTGPVTARLRQALLDIQTGAAPDQHGWLHPLGGVASA